MSLLTFLPIFIIFLLPFAAESQSLPAPDILIIGAGTAGCVLAGRLCTRLPNLKFAILERARPRDAEAVFLVRSPRNARAAGRTAPVAEFFDSQPNPGLNNRTVLARTGSTYGGSSSINAMQFTVPLREAVEEWGVLGLNYSVSKRFFRRAFKKVGFAVQKPPLRMIYSGEYVDAAGMTGFPEAKNPFSGRTRDAVWENFLAADELGRRVDSCSAYVEPVRFEACKDNLRVIQGATVTKVILDKENKRALGVQYVETGKDKGGDVKVVMVRKEVIVAAGPYGSPKLLELSGIGRKKVLKRAGVEVRVDLGVGEKTQGRAAIRFTTMYSGVPIEPSNDVNLLTNESREQFERGEGGVYGTATSAVNLVFANNGYGNMGMNGGPGNEGLRVFSTACFGNPESFGSLHVRDSNPFSEPILNVNLLSDTRDVTGIVECAQKMSRIHAKLDRRFNPVDLTPSGMQLNETYARANVGMTGHFVGGCQVGRVVGDTLRVKGIQGLRVLDASVFKRMPRSAGPLASTYMLAEYGAHRIARAYKCRLSKGRVCQLSVKERRW